jgi:hypothetical protein
MGSGCIASCFLDLGSSCSERSALRPDRFTPEERVPGTHWIGGWVDPRASVDDVEKRKFLTLLGLELRPLSRPARNQSLYRLRCPGSVADNSTLIKVQKPTELLKRIRSYVTVLFSTTLCQMDEAG